MLLLVYSARLSEDNSSPDEPGWIVFTPGAVAHEGPRTDSPTVRTVNQGEELWGDYYVDAETDEEWLVTEENGRKLYIPRWCLHRIHEKNLVEGNLPIGEEVVDRWWGLPLEYEASDLQAIPVAYRWEKDKEYPVRAEVCDALVKMLDAAKQDGLIIFVNSAYRSGEYQKGLYERAVKKDGANQRYSAPPGHSEHQLGTCVDLTDAKGEFAFTEEFGTCPEGVWLEQNAEKFGFKRSYYPHNVTETGYISEPWHWRYWGHH